MVKVKKKKHKISNRVHQKHKKHISNPTFSTIQEEIILPFSSRNIKYATKGYDMSEGALLKIKSFKEKRLTPLEIMDTIVNKVEGAIMAFNSSDSPITIRKGEVLGKVMNLSELDDKPNPQVQEEINSFVYFTKTMVKSHNKPPQDQTKEEQEFAETQLEQPAGPKTAEVPEFEDIPKEQLITSLDINPRLTKDQRAKLDKILMANHRAFSLDGRIGKYEGIQYEINLLPDATPVSLPPYSASPEKREAIDKQLDKWYSQNVIEPSDSPWGAPVIVVYRNGKPRVCIDYRKVNLVSQADEYPLPKQTDILQALMGSQWLSTFEALSGFQQVEIKKDHRSISAFRCHRGLLQFNRLPFGV